MFPGGGGGLIGAALLCAALLTAVVALPVGAAPSTDRPTGLTAASAVGGVELNWQAPASDAGLVTGYKIERGVVGSGSVSTLTADTASTATSYLDATAVAGTHYKYRVSAIRGAAVSKKSPKAKIVFEPPATIGTLEFIDESEPEPETLQQQTEQDNDGSTAVHNLRFYSGYNMWQLDPRGYLLADAFDPGVGYRRILDRHRQPTTLHIDGDELAGYDNTQFIDEHERLLRSYTLAANGEILRNGTATGYRFRAAASFYSTATVLEVEYCCTHIRFNNPLVMVNFDGRYRMERIHRRQYQDPDTLVWPDQPEVRYFIFDMGARGGSANHRISYPGCGTKYFRVAPIYDAQVDGSYVVRVPRDGDVSGNDSLFDNQNDGSGYRRGAWSYVTHRGADC